MPFAIYPGARPRYHDARMRERRQGQARAGGSGQQARAAAAPRLLRWAALLIVLAGISLVPFALIGDAVDAAVRDALAGAPPLWWAGLLIMALLAADVLLPVPSSLLSVAAGGLFGPAGGACLSWLGMTLGCEIAYWLGRQAGRSPMRRLVGGADWARVESAARRRGAVVLALFRPVPVLAEASILFAGAARMPRGQFLLFTAVPNLVISAIYAFLGAYFTGALAPGG